MRNWSIMCLMMVAAVPATAQQGRQLTSAEIGVRDQSWDIGELLPANVLRELTGRDGETRLRFDCVIGVAPNNPAIRRLDGCRLTVNPAISAPFDQNRIALRARAMFPLNSRYNATNPSGPVWFELRCGAVLLPDGDTVACGRF